MRERVDATHGPNPNAAADSYVADAIDQLVAAGVLRIG
jgi:hypothetical protein